MGKPIIIVQFIFIDKWVKFNFKRKKQNTEDMKQYK